MNLISFSLWGNADRYTLGALANARLAPAIYPGWIVRFYCSPEVMIVDELRQLGADVQVMPAPANHAGLFWRFLPMADERFEHVVVRDADSRLNLREKAAVDAWIASGQPFHLMRDHPHHRHTPILGGMWGGHGGSLPDMAARVSRFVDGAAKHDDTRFLREEIWPLICDRALTHSSVPDPLGGAGFPAHAPCPGYVGEVIEPRDESGAAIALLIPSRGRPAAAYATASSARAHAAHPELLQLLVGIEPEESASYCEAFGDDGSWLRVLGSGGNYVRAVRELRQTVSASIVGLSADDFVFERSGWDDIVRDAVADLPCRLGVVYGDDGLQRERLATAPFLTAEWIDVVGDVLPGRYTHMFCDTELTDIARRAGLLHFLPHMRITHRHHLAGAAAVDATYERSATTWNDGQQEFDRRTLTRERLARRLTRAAGRPPARFTRGLPSMTQRLLLTAACRADGAALQAWNRWSATVAVEHADVTTARLFPLVWWNFERRGVAPGTAHGLLPHYRHSWAASHEHADATAIAARTFDTAGISAVIVGGSALGLRYYASPALRPCGVLDVMVLSRQSDAARRLLAALVPVVPYRIHTTFLGDASPRDGRILQRVDTLDIEGATIRMLSPGDELLRLCTRMSRRPDGAIVWVADVVAVLGKANAAIDWDAFVDECRARRRVTEVMTVLDYVRATFDLELPEGVSRRLTTRKAAASR